MKNTEPVCKECGAPLCESAGAEARFASAILGGGAMISYLVGIHLIATLVFAGVAVLLFWRASDLDRRWERRAPCDGERET